MNEQDLAYARLLFPHISHLLDHPQLRAKFADYEKEANETREWVRRLGFAAVISAGVALLAIATEPVWLHETFTRWCALVIELGGVFAALVAAGGLWLGPWKRRWLESRLMTERLRQWHFQLLVRRGQQVEASCTGPSAIVEFEKERVCWFEDFLQSYEGKLDAQLESLTDEASPVRTWLHDPATAYSSNSEAFLSVFAAYKRLRFDHQYNYAIWKLRKSTDKPIWHFLKWPAICQMALLSSISSACFVFALGCSVVLIYGYATDILAKGYGLSSQVELYVRTGALALALIGAALRTLQEGLAPDKEIERYNDYRGRTSQLRDRFEHTTEMQERIHLMEDLEVASVEEMKGFVRTHHNARFVLT